MPGKGERMLQEHKITPREQYPVEIYTLCSILRDLQMRGYRLRHPETQAENETANTLDLRGEQGSAVSEMTEVCDGHKSQSN